jgi:hypothetical protein
MKYLKIILLLIFSFGCANKESDESKKAEHEISGLLDSKVKENKYSFQLDGLSFDWDSLLVVPPYTVLRKAESFSGMDVKVLEKTEIEFRDDVCVLAFLKGGKIISYAEMKRNYDFSELPTDRLYSKSDVFHLVQDKLTKSRYVVKEK